MSSSDAAPPAAPRRFVTAHDDKGLAKVWLEGDIKATTFKDPSGKEVRFYVPWMTTGFPIDNSGTEDVGAAETLSNENGTTCRYVDFPPNSISPMHRTTSLDYGVVIFGDVVLEMDNGDEREMKQSDVCVQRGSNHRWHNRTDKWARMMFVLISSKPVMHDGKPLGDAGHGKL